MYGDIMNPRQLLNKFSKTLKEYSRYASSVGDNVLRIWIYDDYNIDITIKLEKNDQFKVVCDIELDEISKDESVKKYLPKTINTKYGVMDMEIDFINSLEKGNVVKYYQVLRIKLLTNKWTFNLKKFLKDWIEYKTILEPFMVTE